MKEEAKRFTSLSHQRLLGIIIKRHVKIKFEDSSFAKHFSNAKTTFLDIRRKISEATDLNRRKKVYIDV